VEGGVATGVADGAGGAGRPPPPAALVAVTSTVGSEITVLVPIAFVPVATIRSVCPTSAVVATYWSPVAPAMSAQLAPSASQRRHRKVNEIVSVPVQWPRSMARVLPARGVPETVGGTVLSGGSPAGRVGAATTAAVGSESCRVVPPGPAAVRATRTVWPASAALTSYMRSVWPGIGSHAPPVASHRSHWYTNVRGPVPVQVPGSTASVSPTRGVPVTAGAAVLRGASPAIGSVGADSTVFVPAELVAVTRTRRLVLTPSATGVHVAAVAPSMGTHAPDPQRSHW
jgi:hypothetical protein